MFSNSRYFRKFRYKIEWNKKFPETFSENSGQPLEVVHFFGNSGNFLFNLTFPLSFVSQAALQSYCQVLKDDGDRSLLKVISRFLVWLLLTSYCALDRHNSYGTSFCRVNLKNKSPSASKG